MSLTRLDDLAVRAAFERAAARFQSAAVLHREVEDRLLERLAFFDHAMDRVLDLGCGTGETCMALQRARSPSLLVGLDYSTAMLQRWPTGASAGRLCADMRALPLAARSMDLVISNMAIHWCRELPLLFAEVCRVLKPGGTFLFSTCGPDTLKELKASWAKVDSGPHVNDFVDLHDLGDLLVAAGFRDPVMGREDIVVTYGDPERLLRELKDVGATNSASARRKTLTGKGRLARMMSAYDEFRTDGRYPASCEVVFGAATAPAEGQPVRTPKGEVAHFSVDALRATHKRP